MANDANTDSATPGEGSGSSGELPDDLIDEASDTAVNTLLDIWQNFTGHLPFILGAFVVLMLTWGVSKLIDMIGSRALGRWKRRESVKELILRLLSIVAWVVGLLLTAIVLFPGLTPARALGGMGLVSIAVGFAFKDIFENFFAGILILWRFPFEKGDFIECEQILGRVEKVHVRMTYIRETTGELVVVPNSFLFMNPVRVLTDRAVRRVTVMAGVAYGEDVSESVEVITAAVERCETVDHGNPIEIFPQAFGSSSIDIEVTWWTQATPLEVRRSRGEVVTAVKRALDEAGIEIPFPYRTLTFKEPLPLIHDRKASGGARDTPTATKTDDPDP